MLNYLLYAVFGYLIGSLPSAFLYAKRKGGNIYEQGSGNPGATNTLVVYGKKGAFTVLVLDVLKGFLPTLLVLLITGDREFAAWAGTGAVLGHVASLYSGFRGGKALATAGGVLLVLYTLPLAVIVVSYVLLVLLLRYIVIATTLVILGATFAYLLSDASLPMELALLTMVTGILYRHLANWERVVLRTEPKIGDPVSELTLQRFSKTGKRKLVLGYFAGAAVVVLFVVLIH